MDVWIEIPVAKLISMFGCVTSSVGVWVEILNAKTVQTKVVLSNCLWKIKKIAYKLINVPKIILWYLSIAANQSVRKYSELTSQCFFNRAKHNH